MAEEAPNAVKDAKAPDPEPGSNFVLDTDFVLDTKITIFTLMERLEKESDEKVILLHQNSINNSSTLIEDMKKTGDTIGDKLLGIMDQGAQEFKKETGRNMTYSEMRYMYG